DFAQSSANCPTGRDDGHPAIATALDGARRAVGRAGLAGVGERAGAAGCAPGGEGRVRMLAGW
ncbi:hypothetical protein, partial [Nocardia tengchongensis]